VDNQVYVAMCSPARDISAGYIAWGHSTIVDPNGEVVAKAGEGEEIIYADLSTVLAVFRLTLGPDRMEEVRRGIPVTTQRRYLLYLQC
jgi:omega-amidase